MDTAIYTIKAPDSSHEPECACTRSAEQSIFMDSDVCVSRHVRLLRNSQDEREIHIILAVFIMKVPDSSHEPERACTRRVMDIGRASRYE